MAAMRGRPRVGSEDALAVVGAACKTGRAWRIGDRDGWRRGTHGLLEGVEHVLGGREAIVAVFRERAKDDRLEQVARRFLR